MNKLPYTAYDFFSYLIPGLLVLLSFDFLTNQNWLLSGDLSLAETGFWIIVAYTLGHILATPSQWILEKILAVSVIGHPIALLLGRQRGGVLRWIFRGYAQALPKSISEDVLSKLPAAVVSDSVESIFIEMYYQSKNLPETSNVLNTYMNLYGFSRNLAFVALVVIVEMILLGPSDFFGAPKLLAIGIGFGIFVGLLFRYLKFYRLHAREVILGYLYASRQ